MLGLAVLTTALTWPAATAAQIRSWHDENGTLFVSNRQHETLAAIARHPRLVAGTTAVRSAPSEVPPVPSRLDAIVVRHALAHGVRPELIRAVIQTESAFDPWARSPKGAMGLMQLMPGTAAAYGVSDPYDPDQNVHAGVAYLSDLLGRYGGNEELALAAYNAGPNAVDRFGRQVPPYPETRLYVSRVKKVTSLAEVSRVRIYRTVDIVDGREVPRYTNVRPGSGAREVVMARRR
jgi:soluble lytic murein transglycosylase-like protein